MLLALASVYALDRDAQLRSEIDALLAFLDQQLRSPHGSYLEGSPASMPRRQNPQMHLFEAMIAAFDATHDAAFQHRASEFFALFLPISMTSRTRCWANISRRTGRGSTRQRRTRTSGGMGLAAEGFRANYGLPDRTIPRRTAGVGVA